MAFSEDLERAVTKATAAASRRLVLKRVGALAIAMPIGLLVLQACGGEEATPTAVPAIVEETEAAEEEATMAAEETEVVEDATPATGADASPVGAASPVAAASPIAAASPVAGASPVAAASPIAAASPVAADATPVD